MDEGELLERNPDAGRRDRLAEDLLRAQARALEKLLYDAPLTEILQDLTQAIEALDDRTAVAAILLLDERGRLWTGAAPGLPDAYNAAIDGLVAQAELGTCSHAAVTGEVVITPDIDACPRWAPLKSLPLGLGLVAAWSQPIVSRDGRVLGTFGTYFRERRAPTELERRLVETLSHTAAVAIERHRTRTDQEQQRRLYDRALEAAEMGAWRYDLITHLCRFSPRAQALYGLSEAEFLHDEAGVQALIHREDRAAMWAAVTRAAAPDGDGKYEVEYRVARTEGGWRWLRVWGMAEFEGRDTERRAVRLLGASRDITAEKEAERRQRLLLDELNHRVKNNLAIVQSIAAQTLRNQPEPRAFADLFTSRVTALARAHTLLTDAEWRGAALTELVETALKPFGRGGRADPFCVDGPPVQVAPSTAVTLALVLHELATNAAKYGALSAPEGRVEIRWTTPEPQDLTVALDWRESQGPTVLPPTRKGFGSRLLSMMSHELGGSAGLTFDPAGVACALRFLPQPASSDRAAD